MICFNSALFHGQSSFELNIYITIRFEKIMDKILRSLHPYSSTADSLSDTWLHEAGEAWEHSRREDLLASQHALLPVGVEHQHDDHGIWGADRLWNIPLLSSSTAVTEPLLANSGVTGVMDALETPAACSQTGPLVAGLLYFGVAAAGRAEAVTAVPCQDWSGLSHHTWRDS